MVERIGMLEFQRVAHLHLQNNIMPDEKRLIDWWTLMQHYGAPTRLLDWSRSPYVALYFAVEKEFDCPGNVWVVRIGKLENYMEKKHGIRRLPDGTGSRMAFLLDEGRPARLVFDEPKTQSDRMAAQKTCFSVCSQILGDHGEIIEEATASQQEEQLFWKITIPETLKPEFLHQLRIMNVTASSLFPGIDGVGRSISEYIKLGCQYEIMKQKEKGINNGTTRGWSLSTRT